MAPIAVTNVAHARSLTRAHRVPFRYGDCHGNIASIGQQSSQPPRHGHGQAHEPIPSSHCRSPSLVAHYRSRFWRQDCVLSKTACEHQPTGCMRHAASLWYAKTPWPNSNSYCHRTSPLCCPPSPRPSLFLSPFFFPSRLPPSRAGRRVRCPLQRHRLVRSLQYHFKLRPVLLVLGIRPLCNIFAAQQHLL